MEIQDGIKFLVEKYSFNDWYDSVGLDKYGRYVVYVSTMNMDVMKTVQEVLEGKQVLIHFAGSKPENLKKYTVVRELGRTVPTFATKPVPVSPIEEEEFQLDELILELDRMEKICGSSVLECIFYEKHDGKYKITNISNKFPEIEIKINSLYKKYGFDIMYDLFNERYSL